MTCQLPLAVPNGTYSFVTLCASHITEPSRLAHLRNLLRSCLNQTLKKPTYVSISYDTKMKDEVHKMVSESQSEYVKIFEQKQCMSQFEHYKYLVEQIDPLFVNTMWCAFTDDDDFLNPRRNNAYDELIRKTVSTDVCIAIRSIMISSWDDDNINYETLMSYLTTGARNTVLMPRGSEHIVYCVKLPLLKRFCQFMDKRSKLVTKHCDVVFSAMLFYLCSTSITQAETMEWMYAYNQTHTHSRTCHTYGVDYYVQTYDDKLFEDLAQEFGFTWWNNLKGYASVYTIYDHREALRKLKHTSRSRHKCKRAIFTSLSILCTAIFTSLSILCTAMASMCLKSIRTTKDQ